jgi:hypothetical protein
MFAAFAQRGVDDQTLGPGNHSVDDEKKQVVGRLQYLVAW